MRRAIRTGLAISLLLVGGSPVVALDFAPGVNLPTIGFGGIGRVPCEIWESETPVPFVGSTEGLTRLCPGNLSVQLYRLQARLLRRHACYHIEGYAVYGALVHDRRCLPYEHRTGLNRRWEFGRQKDRGDLLVSCIRRAATGRSRCGRS